MSLDELMKLVLGALEDLKAQNIQVLDVHELTTITERMVICSGTSSRQVKALADNVVKEAKQHG
ncbi:MAG: ribosome silencing factor, partial [Salinisphaeraceae bacterium]|nr:ribosome silencing factor [Salinisphaeraceae bacterium]